MKEDASFGHRRIPPYQLILLFIMALVPRVTGLITFVNPDELWGASVRVLTGDLSAGTSQTLPLINYLNAASFAVLYALGRLVGVWHTAAEFRTQYFSDNVPFVFAGRFVAASLGALSAPLSALIASRLGLSRRSSLIVGAMLAILPINVWCSHFAKPDSGVAFGVLFLVWSLLRKLDAPNAKGADVLVGVAIAIVMSFKQTALFVLAPALVGYVALLHWESGLEWLRVARGLFVAFVTYVVAWVPMNIGILLDIPGFLDYQRALVAMMSRSATTYQIAELVIRLLADNVSGLTVVGLLVWLFSPGVRRDWRFLILWGSVFFAYVAFSAISGGLRITARYFLPFDELAFTLGCIAALTLVERGGRSRLVGGLLTVAILVCEGLGSGEVVRQALTAPIRARCAEALAAIADREHDKILAANPYLTGVPIDPAAREEDYRRHQRLAKKYGITLPERAPENKSHKYRTAPGYYVRPMGFAMGGMEDLEREKAEAAVKPFWWPLQDEEWSLDYWAAQGFNIFVVSDETGPGIVKVPAYRSMYQQIKERCEQLAVLTCRRDLFGEGKEVKIYRLRELGRREDAPR